MTALQENRHRATQTTIDRVLAQRDDALTRLMRAEARLRELQRLAARQAKALTKPAPAPTPKTAPKPELPPDLVAEVTAAIGHAPVNADQLTIPPFLERRATSHAADAAAATEIAEQQEARKRAKSQGRIAKMKAKASGDTKKMPLTGRAALAHIRGAG